MKLDKTFENEVKKVSNGDGSREYKFALKDELKEVSAALANRYDFDNCISKYGRVKVALCVAATIFTQARNYGMTTVGWAFEVMLLWKNKNEHSVLNAMINIHPAILSDNSSRLRKLTTERSL